MDEHRQRDSLTFDKISKKKKRSRFLQWQIDNPILVGGFIAIVMVCIVLITGSNLGTDVGIIHKSDIGTIAAFDYKAPRDFTFKRIDREATDKIREQRVAEVLPIYKWDRAYRDTTIEHIRSAFELMRNGMAQESARLSKTRVPLENGAVHAQESPEGQAWADLLLAKYADESLFADYLSTRAVTQEEISEALVKWTKDHQEDFVHDMGYVIDDTLYNWLVSDGFSEMTEDGLLQVFDVVLNRMIVSATQDIENVTQLNVQWYEGGEKKQKTVSKSEKSTISTLSASESLVSTLIREKFANAPESFLMYFKQFVRPNLTYDEAATQRERQNVSDKTAELSVIEEYKKGQTIVGRGDPIRQSHYEIFEEIAQNQGDSDNAFAHWTGLILIMSILFLLSWKSILASSGRRQKNRDIIYFATGVLVYVAALKLADLLCNVLDSVYHWPYSILLFFPFSAGPMLMRSILDRSYAYLFAVVSIILTGLIVEENISLLCYTIACAIVGCLLMERPKRSNMIYRYGMLIGIIDAVVSVALYLVQGSNMTWFDYAMIAILGFVSGVLSMGCVMIGLPLAESVFGYVTYRSTGHLPAFHYGWIAQRGRSRSHWRKCHTRPRRRLLSRYWKS